MNKIKSKRINKAGGITFPVDVRRDLNLSSGDAVDIEVADGKLIIQQHCPKCFFCSGNENVKKYKGKEVCTGCIREMSQGV